MQGRVMSKEVSVASSHFTKERDYWLETLAGELVKTSVPYDVAAAGKEKPALQTLQFTLPPDVAATLEKIGKGNDFTRHMALVAAIVLLLYRYTGHRDIIVGAPIYDQESNEEFVNTVLPLRQRLTDDMSFKQLLLSIRQMLVEADQHQNFPLETLLYRLSMPLSETECPLFDTAVLLEGIHRRGYLDGVPLNLVFSFRRDGEELAGSVEYNRHLYKESSIRRVISHLSLLTAEALANLDRPILDIDILAGLEREEVLALAEGPEMPLDANATIGQMFEDKARRFPDRVAVIDAETQMTYSFLETESRRVAAYLMGRGIEGQDIVALAMDRTVQTIVAMLGVIRAGAAYLPLELDLPENRIQHMLQDSGAAMTLTGIHDVPPGGHIPSSIGEPHFPVYVLYTSGSTGLPKAAVIEHRHLVNLVAGLERRIYHALPGYLSVAVAAPFVFDASVKQLFAALLLGHRLAIVPEEARADGGSLYDFFLKYSVEVTDGTPTHMRLLLETGDDRPLDRLALRHLIIGGEALPRRLCASFFDRFPGREPLITNIYGLTECCVDSSCFTFGRRALGDLDTIPIGAPMPNNRLLILDRHNRLQPKGIPGELCIGGRGLSRGYLNRPTLTAETFVPDPIHPGDTIYRSGDLARYLDDGNIEFLGRIDHQVKVRGFRIELEEIQHRLDRYPLIQRSVVTVNRDNDGDQYLCAYIVPLDSGQSGDGAPSTVLYKDLNTRQTGIDSHNGQLPLEALKQAKPDTTYGRLHRRTTRLGAEILRLYSDNGRLSDDERQRYMRQILLDGWGLGAQETLKTTTVFVAGAGGIGSPIIQQMALVGIGKIIVCDYDEVELSNLNRQVLHDASRIGVNKALSAKMTIERINPHVLVEAVTEKITADNVSSMVGEAAVIFDCVDDLETKFVLSACAVQKGIPHVLSAMIETDSYAAILHTPHTPCFHCLHDRRKADEIRAVREADKNYKKKPFPVVSPALFVTTGFVCNEVLKILLGHENPAYNKFFLFNQKGSASITQTDGFRQMTFPFSHHFKNLCLEQGFDWDKCWRGRFLEELDIAADADCPVCAGAVERDATVPPALDHDTGFPQMAAVLTDNEPNRRAGLLAALKAGKTAVLLDPQLPHQQLAEQLDRCGARVVVADPETLPLARDLRDRVNSRVPVIDLESLNPDESLNLPDISLDPRHEALLEFPVGAACDEDLDTGLLRNYLLKDLPYYMIPSYFVPLDKIPLTAGGKVDRKALPQPEARSGGRYIAPRDHWERELVDIWSEVLGIEAESIGIDAGFFDLGGHSLKAVILISKIHQRFHKKIPLQEIFKKQTIRQLADLARDGDGHTFAAIPPAEPMAVYPLSSAQKRLYFLWQLDKQGTSYNLVQLAQLKGNLDRNRLEETFRQLIRRHESLRTAFVLRDNLPAQKILPEAEFFLRYEEMAESDVKAFAASFIKPFDLASAPLFEAALLKVEDNRYILVVNMHHIISDGTSQTILMREFMELYSGRELEPLGIQYKDFSQWQHTQLTEEGTVLKQQEQYWLERFQDGVPLLNLPGDFPRPPKKSFDGHRLEFFMEADQLQALKKMAQSNQCTLFMVLLAIYNVLLYTLSGQTDLVVGTPVAGRHHADLQSLIGMFVNMLPLRNRLDPRESFTTFLQTVRQTSTGAFANQDYKLEDLAATLDGSSDQSRNPLFDAVLTLQNMDIPTITIPGLELGYYPYVNPIAKFDLAFFIQELDGRLLVWVEYCSKLFAQETIELFIGAFRRIAATVIQHQEVVVAEIETEFDGPAAEVEVPHMDLGF
jgi:amino acid adenylation domain-containing protein